MHVGKFARGLGPSRPTEREASVETPDSAHPLTMMTGRILYHYDAGAMTMRMDGIDAIEDEPFIELDDADAAAHGIEDGDIVEVASRRGKI